MSSASQKVTCLRSPRPHPLRWSCEKVGRVLLLCSPDFFFFKLVIEMYFGLLSLSRCSEFVLGQ